MNHVYPWQKNQWQQLATSRSQNKLPHALLLSGAAGLGKLMFAQSLAAALLCYSPTADGYACGTCKSCLLFANDAHPDYIFMPAEESGGVIKIDQIRTIVEINSKTSQISNYQVIIIPDADNMNSSAANALLKTLEEPQGNTVMLLITSRPSALLATIRSRCQMINFSLPTESMAMEWMKEQGDYLPPSSPSPSLPSPLPLLSSPRMPGSITDDDLMLALKLANYAPLKALSILKNDELSWYQQCLRDLQQITIEKTSVIKIANEWQKKDLLTSLNYFVNWLTGLINNKISNEGQNKLSSELRAAIANIPITKLYLFLDNLLKARTRIQNNANLNNQLLIEDLLVQWVAL